MLLTILIVCVFPLAYVFIFTFATHMIIWKICFKRLPRFSRLKCGAYKVFLGLFNTVMFCVILCISLTVGTIIEGILLVPQLICIVLYYIRLLYFWGLKPTNKGYMNQNDYKIVDNQRHSLLSDYESPFMRRRHSLPRSYRNDISFDDYGSSDTPDTNDRHSLNSRRTLSRNSSFSDSY